jgi:hypothetical protein
MHLQDTCAYENCYFLDVEDRTSSLRVTYVNKYISDAFSRPGLLTTSLQAYDGILAKSAADIETQMYKNISEDFVKRPLSYYTDIAAASLIARMKDTVRAETATLRKYEEAVSLKFNFLQLALGIMGYPYDIIAELNLREAMRNSFDQALPDIVKTNGRYVMPEYVPDLTMLPLASSMDLFVERTNLRRKTFRAIQDRRSIKDKTLCREISLRRPPELDYEAPRWKRLDDMWFATWLQLPMRLTSPGTS